MSGERGTQGPNSEEGEQTGQNWGRGETNLFWSSCFHTTHTCTCTHAHTDIVSLDSSSSKLVSQIHSRVQAVAGEVQGVCIAETPTPQPMRLVVTSVINQILLSLVNAFSHLDSFFNLPLSNKLQAGFKLVFGVVLSSHSPSPPLPLPPSLPPSSPSLTHSDSSALQCAR